MTHDEARDMLADYLGGELDDAPRQRFENYLAGDAELAAEVESLRGALAAMRALDMPGAAPAMPEKRADFSRSAARTVLRYAAVIIFAFGAGYVTRNAASGPPDGIPSAIVQPGPKARDAAKSWETRVAIAYARQPGRSGLARALIALSHATREP